MLPITPTHLAQPASPSHTVTHTHHHCECLAYTQTPPPQLNYLPHSNSSTTRPNRHTTARYYQAAGCRPKRRQQRFCAHAELKTPAVAAATSSTSFRVLCCPLVCPFLSLLLLLLLHLLLLACARQQLEQYGLDGGK